MYTSNKKEAWLRVKRRRLYSSSLLSGETTVTISNLLLKSLSLKEDIFTLIFSIINLKVPSDCPFPPLTEKLKVNRALPGFVQHHGGTRCIMWITDVAFGFRSFRSFRSFGSFGSRVLPLLWIWVFFQTLDTKTISRETLSLMPALQSCLSWIDLGFAHESRLVKTSRHMLICKSSNAEQVQFPSHLYLSFQPQLKALCRESFVRIKKCSFSE